MKILHWNCQGLRNPLKIPYLKDIINTYRVDILLLVETKNKNDFVQQLGKDLHFSHQFLVSPNGLSGGLAIFWQDTVECDFVSTPTLHYTDIKITEGFSTFYLTYIYGNPYRSPRQQLWNYMSSLAQAGFYQGKSRVVLGDFNEIKENSEKLGGSIKPAWYFSNFRRMLNVSGLHEVKTFGGQFSWMGNRRNGHLKIKLDRVVANSDWQEQFPNAKAQLLHWIGSDHRPLLLFTDGTTWRGLKQFKYDNRWKNLTEIHNLIKDTWLSKCNNLPPQAFHEALKTYRSCLSQWRRRNNWNSAKKIQKLYTDLQKASDIDVILQLIKPRVSSSMNLKLTEPVTEKEIFHALSQMNDDKTPGPDGFTAAFFKNHWDVIKSDTWCNWVMKCISSVTYSVLINGSPTEKLHPQRGLRQATREECSHVLQLLQIYANASGQYTNFQKSALLFAKSHISSSKI